MYEEKSDRARGNSYHFKTCIVFCWYFGGRYGMSTACGRRGVNVSRMAEVEKLALYYACELPHGKIILLEFKGWQYFRLYSLTSKATLGRSISQSIASPNEASPAHGINCRFHPQLRRSSVVLSLDVRFSLLRSQCLPTTFLLPGLGHL